MQINASFDFAADTPQAERNNFVSAVNTVIGYFDGLFTNNVTLNIKFALGEDYLSDNGTTISYERMLNINDPGSLLGSSFTRYEIRDYTTVRNLLLTKTDTLQRSVERHYTDLAERASDALGNIALVQGFARVEAEVTGLRNVVDNLLAAQVVVRSKPRLPLALDIA